MSNRTLDGGAGSVYRLRQAETAAARLDWERASLALELAKIRERLAELKSQSEPLHAICDEEGLIGDKILAGAHFVVVGRWPE